MSAYVINSKGVCMTHEMRKDRETLNTMDEMAYQELETENKKLKDKVRAAEGETSIVKGIGINSPEMRGLQTENKNLKNLLGEANDKITVLQLQAEPSLKERGEQLEKSLSIALDINDKYQRENKELKDGAKEKKDWKVTLSYDIHHNDTYLISNETREDAIDIAENNNNSPKYDCLLINEDESDIEDTDTTIKEVVFNTEKKEWIDKEKK